MTFNQAAANPIYGTTNPMHGTANPVYGSANPIYTTAHPGAFKKPYIQPYPTKPDATKVDMMSFMPNNQILNLSSPPPSYYSRSSASLKPPIPDAARAWINQRPSPPPSYRSGSRPPSVNGSRRGSVTAPSVSSNTSAGSRRSSIAAPSTHIYQEISNFSASGRVNPKP